jgi:transcriptional regulator with XRE-family HTH domain
MSTLSATFATELRRTLTKESISRTDAAKALRISRQALYNYLNGVSVPREKVLARAMELWGLEVRVGNIVFTKDSFHKRDKPEPVAKQLNLLAQLDAIKQKDLQLNVKRVGKVLKVSVEIGIPA